MRQLKLICNQVMSLLLLSNIYQAYGQWQLPANEMIANFLSFLNKGHLKLFLFSLDQPSRNILKKLKKEISQSSILNQ